MWGEDRPTEDSRAEGRKEGGGTGTGRRGGGGDNGAKTLTTKRL